MAAGTATVVSRRVLPDLFGLKAVEVTLQPSNSYETPGDIVVPAQVGLTTFTALFAFPTNALGPVLGPAHTTAELQPGVSVTLGGTATAPKVQFWATANTEVANLVDQSAFRVPIVFLGA